MTRSSFFVVGCVSGTVLLGLGPACSSSTRGTGGAASSSSGSSSTGGAGTDGGTVSSSSSSSSGSSGTGGAGTGGAASSSSSGAAGVTASSGGASSSSSSSSGTCDAGTGDAGSSDAGATCPGVPVGAPTTSWIDCSAGLDPCKNGGDLLWTTTSGILANTGGPVDTVSIQLSLGPTGDVLVTGSGYTSGGWHLTASRFNGSGAYLSEFTPSLGSEHPGTGTLDRQNNIVVLFGAGNAVGGENLYWVDPAWQSLVHWQGCPYGSGFNQWDSDVLGNFFASFGCGPQVTLDGTLTLPDEYADGGSSSYLVRGGTMGESYRSAIGSLAADQTGGVYGFGALTTTLDLGCGPMVPTSTSSGYLVRLGPTWGCVYGRVLPAAVSAVTFTNGDVVLSVTSSTALDLGCGTLVAASGGSTFVTRLDGSGSCVFGKALPAPNLTVALDAIGRVVVSGLVGDVSVDLGGGPLAPIGSQDFVLGELDAAGNFLWGRRFGAPGVTFTSPVVSTSAAGDVYLRTGWNGTVDLGGGPITAASGDTVVGSYSPSGAHRWSRDFAITGAYQAAIDGCGSLVVASIAVGFNPGCGVIGSVPGLPVTALARYAP